MSRSVALVALLAVLWSVGSTWYYDCKIKVVCGPADVGVDEIAPVPTLVTTPVVVVNSAGPSQTTAAPAAAAAPEASSPHTAMDAPSLTVHFGRKSTELVLTPADEAALTGLLEAVRHGGRLLITGHADGRGSDELKATLAAQRAEILRDWLLGKGVPPTAIAAVESRDDREPIADNATAEGRAENRRAVATLLSPE